jgi:hypothetical protein
MRERFLAKCLCAVVIVAAAGCDHVDDEDVRPSVVAASLAVDAAGHLRGTVHGRYENTATADAVIQKPELQLLGADQSVSAVDLMFPSGFDTSFSPGDVEDATFDVADDGVWTAFCGQSVQLELQHQTVTSGKIIVSLGDHLDVHLACAK